MINYIKIIWYICLLNIIWFFIKDMIVIYLDKNDMKIILKKFRIFLKFLNIMLNI